MAAQPLFSAGAGGPGDPFSRRKPMAVLHRGGFVGAHAQRCNGGGVGAGDRQRPQGIIGERHVLIQRHDLDRRDYRHEPDRFCAAGPWKGNHILCGRFSAAGCDPGVDPGLENGGAQGGVVIWRWEESETGRAAPG